MSLPQFITDPDPSIYLSDNWIVLDYETTNLDKGDPRNRDNRLIYAGWTVGPSHPAYRRWGSAIQGHYGNEFDQRDLVRAIEESDVFVAQNTKFELGWSARLGIHLHKLLPYDTMLGDYMRAGNRRFNLSLDAIAERYGIRTKCNLVSKLIKGGVSPEHIPASLLSRYCKVDVEITRDIFLAQRELLSQRGLLAAAYTANLFTPVLTDIEFNGMHLDSARVQEFHAKYSSELAEMERELQELSNGVNFNSPQQVAKFLYEDMGFKELVGYGGKPLRNKPNKAFPDGAPKTDRQTLLNLKANTPEQERFIDVLTRRNKHEKAVSTYLNLFKKTCDESEGHLQGNFNQAVTQTHRLSSSRPNFQNFDKHFKVLFSPRKEGWLMGERDAAQLEFRVAAELGEDDVARRAVLDGEDVHADTAQVIYGSEPGDADFSEKRGKSKADTFKPLYGGTSGTPEQQEYYQFFKDKYNGIASAQDSWVESALNHGTFTCPSGLTFYYPDLRMTKSGYVEGNTNVRNYPIQYTATGEIIPIGVTYVWHCMKDLEMGSILVNTIHDSIITEEDPDETEKLDEITTHAFSEHVPKYLRDVYGYTFELPLLIESEQAGHWGE